MEIKNDEFITGQLQLNLYQPIRLQTNIHVEDCLKPSDIRGKDILTAISSGDILFWIIGNNPKSISVFNPNVFAKYYQDLKIAGLLTLTYNEFLSFFYSKETFCKNLQERVLAVLPDSSRIFWKYLFSNYEVEKILNSSLFFRNGGSIQRAMLYNPFLLNEKNYLKVKKDAYNLFYIYHNIDVNELDSIKRRFHTIFLGNIYNLPIDIAIAETFKISKAIGKKYNTTIAFKSPTKLILSKEDEKSHLEMVKRIKQPYKL